MKSKYQRIYIIIIIAVVYTMLFNMKLIMADLGQLEDVVQSFKEFIHRYLGSILFSFIFFFAFSFNKVLYSIITIITFICSAIGAYFVYHYQIRINYYTVTSFLHANQEECLHFINMHFLGYLLLAIIVAIWAVILFIKYDYSHPSYSKLSFVSMAFVIFAVILGGVDITEHYLPYNYLEGTYRALTHNSSKNVNKIVQDISLEEGVKNLDVVIIIGESARYDHFHINGYPRNTSPQLDKISNLISFSKMQACNNFTFHAVPCLLCLNYNEYKPNNVFGPSIIQVLNQLNFVTSWIATQGSNSAYETSFNNIANANKYKTLIHYYIDKNDVYDLEIIPFLEQKLLQVSGNQLIILHTRGSHFHYEWRYTKEFKKFTPICERKFFNWQIGHCTDDEIINSYDNTILYTDEVINAVIERMRNRNAIVIYVSDHGESLGENGIYLHGTKLTPEQLHVPLFIWASDNFIKNNSKKFEALRYNKNKNISYMHMFHTILDCIGIKSTIINPNMSLCNITAN
ncbi:Phosphoethanolamine transferase eptB [Rickettsiales bacterium Ac37b]|nr:Phosphoethanolamine transferase eptB [Rickettsiales bacterium Ac37b]